MTQKNQNAWDAADKGRLLNMLAELLGTHTEMTLAMTNAFRPIIYELAMRSAA